VRGRPIRVLSIGQGMRFTSSHSFRTLRALLFRRNYIGSSQVLGFPSRSISCRQQRTSRTRPFQATARRRGCSKSDATTARCLNRDIRRQYHRVMSLPFVLPGKWDTIPDGVGFTDAIAHNPQVETHCGRCFGTGHELLAPDTLCPRCKGSGRGTRRFFQNEAPVMEGEVSPSGWGRCPCCGFRFLLTETPLDGFTPRALRPEDTDHTCHLTIAWRRTAAAFTRLRGRVLMEKAGGALAGLGDIVGAGTWAYARRARFSPGSHMAGFQPYEMM
jgi:hypothetical protein